MLKEITKKILKTKDGQSKMEDERKIVNKKNYINTHLLQSLNHILYGNPLIYQSSNPMYDPLLT